MVACVGILVCGMSAVEEDAELSAPSEGCKKFTYIKSGIAGAGRGLYNLEPLSEGERCCTYDGQDFAADDKSTEANEKRVHAEYNQEGPGGGFRAGYVPPRSCEGVAQLSNDAHRIELPQPAVLSATVQAVLDYTALSQNASGGNNIRQLAPPDAAARGVDAFAFYATREVRSGEELFQAYGFPYWLDALLKQDERPSARLLICLVRHRCDLLRGRTPPPCTTLRQTLSDRVLEIEFHYSEEHGQLRQASGAPLTEALAGGFIVRFLRVALTSPLWDAFPPPAADAELEADAAPPTSARAKLQRLVRHIAADGEATEHRSEWADVGE
jgi:hypothetical protein